jgi:hypothetical protein
VELSCKVDCQTCPPQPGCSIGCGETFTGLVTDVGDVNVIEFTIDTHKKVTIQVVPNGFGGFNLTGIWDPEACESNNNQSHYGGAGLPSTVSNSNLPPGTYYFMVGHVENDDTYDLSLICEDIIQPTIISPENETSYIAQTVDLVAKCSGSFDSYDLNYSLDGQDNVTFASSLPNNVESTVSLSMPEGDHQIYITCINGSVYNSSDIVYFSRYDPYYDFEAWVEGPELFTVGRAELTSIYVRNVGNIDDSYNISFTKEATKNGYDVSHLINVYMPSRRVSLVEPNRIGNTFATITLSGPVDDGSVTFNITSEKSSVYKEVSIQLVTGMPLNLPEFGFLSLIQMLVLVFFIFMINLKKMRCEQN